MSAYECWESQREALRRALAEKDSLADAAYAARHAILQTEQNTLSQLADDELRQQAGVLFSCVKTSVGLLEAKTEARAWSPRSEAGAKPHGAWAAWLVPALLVALLAAYSYLKGLWLGLGLAAAALVTGVLAFVRGRGRKPDDARDEVRVTVKLDADKLLNLLDAQFHAVDRYINDFSYLNEQLRGGGGSADARTLSRFADLMEALYECDPEEREPAEEAAKQLLESMRLRALDYSEASRALFTALPSKTETRTLSPAIVSADDNRLLRRGTAAVRTEVA